MLNDSEVMPLCYSYAELTGNNIRSEYEKQSKIRSRSRRQSSVDFFRSNDCKPPTGDVADVGHPYESVIYDIATIRI